MHKQTAHSLYAALVALAALPLVPVSADAATGTRPSVIALSQKVKGNDVSITYAYLPKDGTLAIFAGSKSEAMSGKPIGKVALSAGDHRNVKVDLSSQPKSGSRLWAVLEQQGGKAFSDDGKPAEESFKAL